MVQSVANRTVDTLLDLQATATAYTASGVVGSIIDLGGNGAGGVVRGHKLESSEQAVIMGDLLLEVSALDIASNDEIYDLVLQFSSDSDFGTAGNIQDGVSISLGAKEVKRTDSDKDDAVGRFILPFRNEFDGTTYRYVRLYAVVAGTTPSITLTARLAKMFQN